MNSNSGFSLIELVIVVTIIGILIIIAVPRMSIYIQESRKIQEEVNADIIYRVSKTLEIATKHPIDFPNKILFNGESKLLINHLNDRLDGIIVSNEPNLENDVWGIYKENEKIVVKNPEGNIMIERE